MNTTIGTCSRCGGRVSVPTIWHGVVPPIPTCESCGATKAQPHGPVVPMDPAPNRDAQIVWPGLNSSTTTGKQ